jgi:uncharacterized membrane protein YgdD (TMEM256/DUF423 family)
MNPSKKILTQGIMFAAMAVIIGAFGAHGIKAQVIESMFETFETGARYHMYHALALILLGIVQHIRSELNFKLVSQLFMAGILFFSGNCYLYAVTGIKVFALLVPIGGSLFIAGWLWWFTLLKRN